MSTLTKMIAIATTLAASTTLAYATECRPELTAPAMQTLAQKAHDTIEQLKTINHGRDQVDLTNPHKLLGSLRSYFLTVAPRSRIEDRGQIHTIFDGIAPTFIELLKSLTVDEIACFPIFMPWLQQAQQNADKEQARIVQQRAKVIEEKRVHNLPHNALSRVYVQYIFVKRCYEARKDYLAINISEPEMAEANVMVRRIEQELKPKLDPGVSPDVLWENADKETHKIPELALRNGNAANLCQYQLDMLHKSMTAIFPDTGKTQKDF